jgi:hypothetical protein
MNGSSTYATGIFAQVFAVMGFLLGTILAFNQKGGNRHPVNLTDGFDKPGNFPEYILQVFAWKRRSTWQRTRRKIRRR